MTNFEYAQAMRGIAESVKNLTKLTIMKSSKITIEKQVTELKQSFTKKSGEVCSWSTFQLSTRVMKDGLTIKNLSNELRSTNIEDANTEAADFTTLVVFNAAGIQRAIKSLRTEKGAKNNAMYKTYKTQQGAIVELLK